MGSAVNSTTDESTSSDQPTLCLNGCGFFGSPATMNLCSKCFKDLQTSTKSTTDLIVNQTEPSSVSPPQQPPSTSSAAEKAASNRCLTCKKKVGVMGFMCKCGSTFCGIHRYPEKHNCEFDFKGSGRDAIAKANPVVKTDKVDRF